MAFLPHIQVKRELIPIGQESEWEQLTFTRLTWAHNIHGVKIVDKITPPAGYVLGMLTAYVDGKKANMDELDTALASIRLTRQDVEKDIHNAK